MQSYQMNTTTIYVMRGDQEEQISLEMFGLRDHIPTLTLVGDTKYKEPEMKKLQPFFKQLAEAVTQPELPTAIIDGATNFGVMRLFGEAFGKVWEQRDEEPTPLIGATLRVAIEEDRMPLEPHHSHIFLTPGTHKEWTKAVPWIRRVQIAITGKKPSALLAVGGGLVTLQHMREHAIAGIPLYVLRGSGDLAQGFVEAQKDEDKRDPAYPYAIDQHICLLKDAKVFLLDLANPQEAIDQLKGALYKAESGFPDETCHSLTAC